MLGTQLPQQALPTIGNKTKPTKVLLNPEDSTTPSIEPIKHLEEKITTMNTTANKINDIIGDDLGRSPSS